MMMMVVMMSANFHNVWQAVTTEN